jgi:hypothetical protein
MATAAPRRNRLGTLTAFVLLVVIGRQFTPHSSSAATGEKAGPTLATALSDPAAAEVRYFIERLPGEGPALFRVRASDGRVVADGLGTAQLAYHFPGLFPGPASGFLPEPGGH